MRCRVCGENELEISKENHHYSESGLSNVTLLNVEVSYCKKCGARIVSIPRMEELHRLLAFVIASQKPRLHGTEIRFLRKYLGLSGKDFANTIGVTQETVSRWENAHEHMGLIAERLLRLMVIRETPIQEYPTQQLAEVAREETPIPHFLLAAEKGWHMQKAA